ncbi:DNase I-like protein [Nadsonia fulvescens var. elongata DSM 6958]|uniref:DNase I-like protein n=1 Tax=Nadsonia fulvescens var. elongata DSM 6958 TaxID=857566 RepID=A0A1E3PM36_9ASCO|nr:DNase I-like protein [Nadsonia fulvescens var. elongata DSM 6958]
MFEAKQYVSNRNISLKAVTWNVCNSPPPSDIPLTSLFLPITDISVLALQEADPYTSLSSSQATLKAWEDAVLLSINQLHSQVNNGHTDSANDDENNDDKEDEGYSMIASNQLLGLHVLVFAKDSLTRQISDLKLSTTGTGLFGLWGNKGAAVIQFILGADTSQITAHEPQLTPQKSGIRITIIDCHLAAGESEKMNQRRRWELSQIHSGCKIPGPLASFAQTSDLLFDRSEFVQDDKVENPTNNIELSNDPILKVIKEGGISSSDEALATINSSQNATDSVSTPISTASATDEPFSAFSEKLSELTSPLSSPSSPSQVSMEYNDIIFLLGDLNYRTRQNPENSTDIILSSDIETLLTHDRLIQERFDGNILCGFVEGKINFLPTYKYLPTSVSDFDPARSPSYTDRIFHSVVINDNASGKTVVCTESNNLVRQTTYKSHMEYTNSDHKPVSANFILSVPLIDMPKRKEYIDNMLKKLSHSENASRPVVIVDPVDISVEDAVVLAPRSTKFVIKNANTGLAQWEILKAPGFGLQNYDFIEVSPVKGSILPNGSEKITVTCKFPIGFKEESITETLILHLKESHDHFITVNFKKLPTFIGVPLDELARIPHGIRNGFDSEMRVVNNIPREIWSLVDFLWSTLDQLEADTGEIKPGIVLMDNLFTRDSDAKLVIKIRDWLDTGMDWDSGLLETNSLILPSVASQLVLLLKNLPQPIIKIKSQTRVSPIDIMEAFGKQPLTLMEELSPIEANTLVYLLSFLRKTVMSHIIQLKTIGKVFSDCLIEKIPAEKSDIFGRIKRAKERLITNLVMNI